MNQPGLRFLNWIFSLIHMLLKIRSANAFPLFGHCLILYPVTNCQKPDTRPTVMEMKTTNLSLDHCDFTITGHKGKHKISFTTSDGHLVMVCDCRNSQPCWHAEYILAGKTSRITSGDLSLQGELIRFAESTSEGRALISKARIRFAGETHCRRCSSERITKIRKSFSARLLTVFKDTTNHTYFCRSCKWTW